VVYLLFGFKAQVKIFKREVIKIIKNFQEVVKFPGPNLALGL
jgi:hypothetical protein